MEFKQIELKENAFNDADFTVKGYASVFGNIDSYGDIVCKGAFSDSLKNKKPIFLFNHNKDFVIGKILSVEEDEKGLSFTAQFLRDLEQSYNVYKLLKNNAISGVSIGYIPLDFTYDKQGNRLIKSIDLWEISIVTFPANEQAQVEQVKSYQQFDDNIAKLYSSIDEFNRMIKNFYC